MYLLKNIYANDPKEDTLSKLNIFFTLYGYNPFVAVLGAARKITKENEEESLFSHVPTEIFPFITKPLNTLDLHKLHIAFFSHKTTASIFNENLSKRTCYTTHQNLCIIYNRLYVKPSLKAIELPVHIETPEGMELQSVRQIGNTFILVVSADLKQKIYLAKKDRFQWHKEWNFNNDFEEITKNLDIKTICYPLSKDNISFAVLTKEGMVYTWGENGCGQLGTEKEAKYFQNTLEQVSGVSDIVNLYGTGTYYLAQDKNGTMHGWGECIALGEIDDIRLPKILPLFKGIQFDSIFCGKKSLFLLTEGKVFAVGANTFGILGLGLDDETSQTEFKSIDGLKDVKIKTLVTQGSHTFAITHEGQVYAWGMDVNGQIGHGFGEWGINKPTLIEKLQTIKIKQIATSPMHTLFLSEEGDVYACGENANGQLGLNTSEKKVLSPKPVPFNKKIAYIEVDYDRTIFRDKTGKIYTSGLHCFPSPETFIHEKTYALQPINYKSLRYFKPSNVPKIQISKNDNSQKSNNIQMNDNVQMNNNSLTSLCCTPICTIF